MQDDLFFEEHALSADDALNAQDNYQVINTKDGYSISHSIDQGSSLYDVMQIVADALQMGLTVRIGMAGGL